MAMHSNPKKWDRMLDEFGVARTVHSLVWDCFAQSRTDFGLKLSM